MPEAIAVSNEFVILGLYEESAKGGYAYLYLYNLEYFKDMLRKVPPMSYNDADELVPFHTDAGDEPIPIEVLAVLAVAAQLIQYTSPLLERLIGGADINRITTLIKTDAGPKPPMGYIAKYQTLRTVLYLLENRPDARRLYLLGFIYFIQHVGGRLNDAPKVASCHKIIEHGLILGINDPSLLHQCWKLFMLNTLLSVQEPESFYIVYRDNRIIVEEAAWGLNFILKLLQELGKPSTDLEEKLASVRRLIRSMPPKKAKGQPTLLPNGAKGPTPYERL